MTAGVFAVLALVAAFLMVGGVGTALADRTPQERVRDADHVYEGASRSWRYRA